MNPDLKRRIKPYATGTAIGVVLSAILLTYWSNTSTKEGSGDKIVVAVSACDLKVGEALEERCVEKREVGSHFVPPGTLKFSSMPPHLGRIVNVDLPKGNAIREDDLR
jgi:Flp pilus assembly protein CpaB